MKGEDMDKKLIFKIDKGRYKVPDSKELYLMHLDYFKGMGRYDDELCHEKALLTTGYYIVQSDEDL